MCSKKWKKLCVATLIWHRMHKAPSGIAVLHMLITVSKRYSTSANWTFQNCVKALDLHNVPELTALFKGKTKKEKSKGRSDINFKLI